MQVRLRVCWFLVNVRAYVAVTVLHDLNLESRKFIVVEDISWVNLMDSTTLFRYFMNVLRESLSPPFQIRNISLMKLIQ